MKGLIGFGPLSMQPKVLVCSLSGGRLPYVPRKERSHFRLVVEADVYVLAEVQAI